MTNADPGNAGITEEMKSYKAGETIMTTKGKHPQRLVYYSGEPWTTDEKVMLKTIKDFCKNKNVNIPNCDPELLRFMYSNKSNP